MVRIYGMFRISFGTWRCWIQVMGNTFPPDVPDVHVYDLKGRKPKPGKSFDERGVISQGAKKDNEITCKLLFSDATKQYFVEQLEHDVNLLKVHDIMDYSLLVGIHKITPQEKAHAKIVFDLRKSGLARSPKFPCITAAEKTIYDRGGLLAWSGREKTECIVFLGIIDNLTKFTFNKQMAHWFKSWIWEAETLSTVQAEFYAERFYMWMTKELLADEVIPGKENFWDHEEEDFKEHVNDWSQRKSKGLWNSEENKKRVRESMYIRDTQAMQEEIALALETSSFTWNNEVDTSVLYQPQPTATSVLYQPAATSNSELPVPFIPATGPPEIPVEAPSYLPPPPLEIPATGPPEIPIEAPSYIPPPPYIPTTGPPDVTAPGVPTSSPEDIRKLYGNRFLARVSDPQTDGYISYAVTLATNKENYSHICFPGSSVVLQRRYTDFEALYSKIQAWHQSKYSTDWPFVFIGKSIWSRTSSTIPEREANFNEMMGILSSNSLLLNESFVIEWFDDNKPSLNTTNTEKRTFTGVITNIFGASSSS
eukprot:TRINITY_DN7038_c0_g1_i1.p1 TRINITY_DN7038_c0_g1~~TRINITY_DN7038_c0_g1_i1.p1  ORF type:complete len:537 (+),score=136.71 TRINITY_DN7038_c0_g1_i1:661-2271(+)